MSDIEELYRRLDNLTTTISEGLKDLASRILSLELSNAEAKGAQLLRITLTEEAIKDHGKRITDIEKAVEIVKSVKEIKERVEKNEEKTNNCFKDLDEKRLKPIENLVPFVKASIFVSGLAAAAIIGQIVLRMFGQ